MRVQEGVNAYVMRRLRRLCRNSGFTLIELLVVILVIAVLMAVAAPSFLGQTKKAQDNVALQELSLSYKAAKALSTEANDQGSYADITAAALHDIEPEINFADNPSNADPTDPKTVYVYPDGDDLILKYLSESGKVCTLTAPMNDVQEASCENPVPTEPPIEPVVLSNATSVTSGALHTCARLSNGWVDCWGWNGNGQVGDGTYTVQLPVATRAGTLTNALSVDGGNFHSCALLDDTSVMCWGGNGNGQLGNGSILGSPNPVQVHGVGNVGFLDGATQIATGEGHTCALISGGTVSCWGDNHFGQLGDGTQTQRLTPVQVSGITNATQIASTSVTTCARLSTGHIMCWGYNTWGQLGDGTQTDSSEPVEVQGVSGATQVAAGYDHACALLSGGTIKCWGLNDHGQAGDGSHHPSTEPELTPVLVDGIDDATQVSVGSFSTCALRTGGTVFCWGYNYFGELGDNSTDDRYTPVQALGVSGATEVTSGANHTCAAISGGTISCWGYNNFNQLGDNEMNTRLTFVQVLTLP